MFSGEVQIKRRDLAEEFSKLDADQTSIEVHFHVNERQMYTNTKSNPRGSVNEEGEKNENTEEIIMRLIQQVACKRFRY